MKSIWTIFIGTVVLLAFNIIAANFKLRWDMTSSGLYSLSSQNEEIIRKVDKRVVATLLMGDKLPASFKKLKNETEFFLTRLHSENENIWYDAVDFDKMGVSQRKAVQQILQKQNINPTNIREKTVDGMSETLIYPYIHLESQSGEIYINILESRKPNETEEDAIYRSIISLESKMSKGLFELSKDTRSRVGIVAFDEFIDRRVFDLVQELKSDYDARLITPQDLFNQKDSCQVAIVPISQKTQIEKSSLLYLDQYVLNGGRLLWLIEEYDVSIDSIDKYIEYIPQSSELLISDYLFHKGVKINGTWLSDWRCSRIPQVVGEQGGQAQTEMLNYPYHAVMKGTNHVISNQLEEINLFFPTVLEILENNDTKVTYLITSSEYSKGVKYPHIFSFDFLRKNPDIESHSFRQLPTAVLMEGNFKSYFKNRLTKKQEKKWIEQGFDFQQDKSSETAQIIVMDQDFTLPKRNMKTRRKYPIGYNSWERRVFNDNQQFLNNSIEYLINGEMFLIPDRKSEYRLAALDKRKIATSGTRWSLYNLFFGPIVLLCIHLIVSFYMKRKYA